MSYKTHGPLVMDGNGDINKENHDFLVSEEGTAQVGFFLYELAMLLRSLRDFNEPLMIEYVQYVRNIIPELSKHTINILEAHQVRGKRLINMDGSMHVYVRDGVNIIAHIVPVKNGHEELQIFPPGSRILGQYIQMLQASTEEYALH